MKSRIGLGLGLLAVCAIAWLSLSASPLQGDDVATLRREIQALKTQQDAMQKDVQAIRAMLQGLLQPRAQGPQPSGPAGDSFVNKMIAVAGEPTRGSASAKVMLVEVSDYHCPFCRRQNQQTTPQLLTEYVNTGKVKYAFVDYPIAQLHPDAFKAHEAANCAGDQGKFWEMHESLFANNPVNDAAALTAQAQALGVDAAKFGACMSTGKHADSIKDSISRMEQLGVSGTPLLLIGLTPPAGQPMKVLASIYGAMPYAEFKTAIDAALAQAR